MSTAIVFHSFAALAYSGLAFILWRALSSGRPVIEAGRYVRLGVLIALVLHAIALKESILQDQHLHLSWSLALSAAVWLAS